MPGRSLLLLDTASLYFRAFYALPDSIRDDSGRPVNAIRGLADFTATLCARYEPSHVVACWDEDWRPAWRVARVPSYKRHRLAEPDPSDEAADPAPPASPITPVASWVDDPETPDALEQQIPRILELLRLAGIPVLGAAGYEADDVIATLSARSPYPVAVATGDRDLFQVIDDERDVRVLYLTRGVAAHAVMTAEALRERDGIEPTAYADFATLRGDPSDGLPGVAGIGAKTAARLLAQFGSLDAALDAAADPGSSLAAGVRAKLLAGADYARAARPVVAVQRDLTLSPSWDDLRLGPGADDPAWQEFTEQVNLGGAGQRLAAALEPLRA